MIIVGCLVLKKEIVFSKFILSKKLFPAKIEQATENFLFFFHCNLQNHFSKHPPMSETPSFISNINGNPSQ